MSQTGKDKPIVFLSHADEDVAIASEIKAWLEQNLLNAVEVFVSSDKGIDPGEEWEHVILEKLRNCSIELVVCTQMSVGRRWVNIEIGGAWVRGVKIIPLCYHDQSTETLPRPLSSRQVLDLSKPSDVLKLLKVTAKEAGLSAPDIDPNGLIDRLPSRNDEELGADGGLPSDVRKLLKVTAKEAGLSAPDIDPNGLIERLPSRNDEELGADGELPDVIVKVNSVMVPDLQMGTMMCFLELKAENHDKNSVFLNLPIIATRDGRKNFSIWKDSASHLPVLTGELKPGDSRLVLVDPTLFEIEDIEQLGEVIFRDKIGREFKGSAEATLRAIKWWKAENEVCSEYHYKNTSKH